MKGSHKSASGLSEYRLTKGNLLQSLVLDIISVARYVAASNNGRRR